MIAPHIFRREHMQCSLVCLVRPEGPRSRAWGKKHEKPEVGVYDAAEYLWFDKVYPTGDLEQRIWHLGD